MSRKILVLDGITATPAKPGQPTPTGEPDWSRFEKIGPLTVLDRTPASEVAKTIGDHALVLTNKAVIDEQVLSAAPSLKYVGVLATGTNVVDLAAAKATGVVVTNVPGYSGASVAQHVFALLLELASKVGVHDAAVHRGDWANCPDFAFTVAPLCELAGKAIGIVGMGDIGQRVGRIAHAMGMTVLAHSRTEKALDYPAKWVSLDELFAEADVVSLHCPLTPETQGMVDGPRLGAMKRSAFLINTGRGPLLDEAAVAAALASDEIAGVGVDVLSTEPPAADNPLLTAPNCVITPHIAWATVEARRRLLDIAAGNLEAFLAGTPRNVVN